MLPSAAAIPPATLAADLSALLGAVGWLAIVPILIALGVLALGIVAENRALAALRRAPGAETRLPLGRPSGAARTAA